MTEPSWTSKDDNRMVISQAMQHVMVNVVPDQHDEITRIRGFDLMERHMRDMGVRVAMDRRWRHQHPTLASQTKAWIVWMRCPYSPSLIEDIANVQQRYAGKAGLCVAVDITFPWAHPEYCTNLGTDYDRTRIERALRTADLVTTSYEQLVPEIADLNPNVIHIPDASDDIEGWEIGATALFTMAMQVCATKRTGA